PDIVAAAKRRQIEWDADVGVTEEDAGRDLAHFVELHVGLRLRLYGRNRGGNDEQSRQPGTHTKTPMSGGLVTLFLPSPGTPGEGLGVRAVYSTTGRAA